MLSTLFGGTCFLCRGAAREVLCAPCAADLPRIAQPLCPRCALPSPGAAVCGRCLAQPPSFDATVTALIYRFPADALLHAFKFRGELALGPLLAGLLAAGPRPKAERLVPVPLSGQRLRERGYNQALELARTLAREAGMALEPALCERRAHGAPQTDLPLAERVKNVRNAFHCSRSLEGMNLAVVDDVMTTGATLEALARTLKDAGAATVTNWVVARTFPPA